MAASITALAKAFIGRPMPKFVKIVEVGPRDGLQNEKRMLPTDLKIELVHKLVDAGLKTVEVTSFVSTKWVPQMKDCTEVFAGVNKRKGVNYPVLTGNMIGYAKAVSYGAREVAVFAGASETFSQNNLKRSIELSLELFKPILEMAKSDNIKVRGYLSCVLGCPYEGYVSPEKVAKLAVKLVDMGCYEISLGDTIGVGTPEGTDRLLDEVLSKLSVSQVAVHFHNTQGRALQNIIQALLRGVSTIDSSVASLGGCPYAPGATGNVSTEDVVFLLSELGIETGVNLEALCKVGDWISEKLGRPNLSTYRLE